jgi:WXG100 family type VII secretion target
MHRDRWARFTGATASPLGASARRSSHHASGYPAPQPQERNVVMTMPTVNTVEEGMRSAANTFAQTADEFNSHLQSVNNQMATLQASWTGQASGQFNQAMDNWENSFKNVINQLLRMLDVMGATTKGYHQAEDTASNTAKNFMDALPPLPGV